MKIVSSFTHPHDVPNLYEFLSFVVHKRRYLRMLVIKQLMVPIDFHSISFPTMEVMFSSSEFFKISSFVFNIKNKLIQVWNDMRVSK